MVQFRGTPGIAGGPFGKAGSSGGVRAGAKVIGLPAALAKLKGVDSVVRLELGLLMAGAASFIEQRAQENAPEDTGNLKSGIKKNKLASYTWEITASTEQGDVSSKNWYEYAPFQEYGYTANGRHMPGQFFMTRAFEDVRPLVAVELQGLARKLERL